MRRNSQSTVKTHVGPKSAPTERPFHVSQKRSTASGGPPSAPDTAFNSLGPATSDVANAFAQEMETMRDHRLLQAKKADRASVGGASRPQTPRLPCSTVLRFRGRPQRGGICFPLSTPCKYVPCRPCVADDPVHTCRSWLWISPTCQRAAQGDVNGQLASVEKWGS